MAERPREPHEDDDEALRWAGDESPVRSVPRGAAAPAAADPVGDAVGPAGDEPAAAEPVVERASSVLLVASGVLGGIYLLFTIGWVLSAEPPALEGLAAVMYVLGQWLAIAAPALWFGATLLLTRHRPAPVKLLWLVIGMLLLVPWPFILNR